MASPLDSAIKLLVNLAEIYGPFLGSLSHGPVERAATVPEADIRKLCKGMKEEDVQEAITIFRRMADDLSDVALLIATKGKVQPD